MSEALFVVDKIPGPTSFDVVRQVRDALGGAKVGHAGSLDPFASGALVLLAGRATKLSGLLLNADKRYHAVVRLGQWTDTLDPTGTIEKEAPVPALTEEKIKEVLKDFEGVWAQTPPMYSAKKLHGVRLYELARQNIRVKRQPVDVTLHEMKFLSYSEPELSFEVHCSKGTYIRSLAEEIGVRLGTVAHLKELRRLSCGQYTLSDAVTVEQLSADVEGAWKRGVDLYRRLLQQEGLFRKTEPNAFRAQASSLRG
jgi:tRNA pseudouridine55 synthase